jgi:hypothetical protein
MRKIIHLILALFIICALSVVVYKKSSTLEVSRFLRSIPQDDREKLEYFFHTLIRDHGFGHVLFGNKSMGWDRIANLQKQWWNPEWINCPFSLLNNYYSLNATCLQTWLHYRHLFPSKKFLLLIKPSKKKCFDVFCINKAEFLKVVRKNIRELQQKLGVSFTAEKFLERIIEEEGDIFLNVFKGKESIFGLLLGYGRENAALFERFFELKYPRKCACVPPRIAVHSLPSFGFSSLEEELAFIEDLTQINEIEEKTFPPVGFMLPLGFRADPNSQETKQLEANYLQEHRKIVCICREGNFLEKVLQQFMQ